MKKLKAFLGVVLSIAVLISASYIYAATSTSSSSAGYTITGYDVDIVVTEENVLQVTETIETNFTGSNKHGIVRDIQTKGKIYRTSGVNGTFSARVSNISVSENYSKSTYTSGSTKYVSLQIGSASKTISGAHTYVISYDYALGDDGISSFDELYFNIIGTGWDTTIDNVTFTITMPKEFDTSKIGFSHGSYGSTNSNGIEYTVDGNVITGSYDSTLAKSEGLTVRIELEEGYFDIPDYTMYIDCAVVVAFVIFVIVAFLLWMRDGKDKPVVTTVEFYPPEGMNSLDVAFAYQGQATQSDVTSLLIYLANSGYVKIDEKEGLLGSKSFSIAKIKEYDGDNEAERIFFDGLFKKKDVVTSADLEDRFYVTVERILSKVNTSKNKAKIIDKRSRRSKGLVMFLIVVVIAILSALYYIVSEDSDTTGELFATTVGVTVFMYIGILGFKKKPLNVIFSVVMVIAGLAIAGNGVELFADFSDFATATYMVGIGTIMFLSFFNKIMLARTELGTQLYGKINGFKQFLENARKEELERLVEENPTYFYDILPYTYVLGVSDKWIKKFESINMRSPQWYDSPNDFSVAHFGAAINRTFNSASRAMNSRPSSSSDGFSGGGGGHSSGGGFSGGGSGGGGGHSW